MIGDIENNAKEVPVPWARQGMGGGWFDEHDPVSAAVMTG
jgi:hypothetical protein